MTAKYIVWNYKNSGHGKVFTVHGKIASIVEQYKNNQDDVNITIIWIKY